MTQVEVQVRVAQVGDLINVGGYRLQLREYEPQYQEEAWMIQPPLPGNRQMVVYSRSHRVWHVPCTVLWTPGLPQAIGAYLSQVLANERANLRGSQVRLERWLRDRASGVGRDLIARFREVQKYQMSCQDLERELERFREAIEKPDQLSPGGV